MFKGAVPMIVVTWIVSLVTTLAVVYVAPNIFPIRITSDNIADSAIITTKLADGNVTTTKIPDYAITNLKLATDSIPCNASGRGRPTGAIIGAAAPTDWADIYNIPPLSVTLTRNSTLLIMFTAKVGVIETGKWLVVRTMVDETVAFPGEVTLTSDDYGPYSFIFYLPNVVGGTHTIKMQWRAWETGVHVYAKEYTLSVIALPA